MFALEVLYLKESCKDVVRESQEIVELTFKGLLRACHMEVPRIHDVSSVLMKHKNAFLNLPDLQSIFGLRL